MPRGVRASGPESGNAPSSVQKACLILRAMSDTRNVRLTDIAQAAGQDKATTLRLLEVLTRHGFVNRDAESKRYSLGPEIFTLGAAAMARSDPRARVRPSLIQLVRSFEDTAILSVPRGAESVCVDVQVGSFAIRANYLEIGSRRPLGVGAGSLALLAWLPDEEIDALMPFIADRLASYPLLSPTMLRRSIEDSRRRGHAMLLDVVVPRMGGIAVPILSEDGRPFASISIAALSERISGRETALAEALHREAAACRAYWRQGGL
ncbi:MAG: IclR family transcriptional regulator [Burkholderiales bacterium]|nr:IclR family transcriptional regulator [Burkholderiales bacterium]